MNSNELFEEFKSYCKKYEIEVGKIVLKNDENTLNIYKPNNPETSKCLLYDVIGLSRESGIVTNINNLIDLVIDVIGNDVIITKEKNPYR